MGNRRSLHGRMYRSLHTLLSNTRRPRESINSHTPQHNEATDRGADNRLAVLIDGENISSKVIPGLMEEVANYGTASVKRIYGDFTHQVMKGWRECLMPHSIVPIQQFASRPGKNATDSAMIIDAMDLLHSGRCSTFCLVTNDSDFTALAARIREHGNLVYGFGYKNNTNPAFVAACHKFVDLDWMSTQAVSRRERPSNPIDGYRIPSLGNAAAKSKKDPRLPRPPRQTWSSKQSQAAVSQFLSSLKWGKHI